MASTGLTIPRYCPAWGFTEKSAVFAIITYCDRRDAIGSIIYFIDEKIKTFSSKGLKLSKRQLS